VRKGDVRPREAKREFQRWLAGAGDDGRLLVGSVQQVGDRAEEQRAQEKLRVIGDPLQGLEQLAAGALPYEGARDDGARGEARGTPVGGHVDDQRR